MVKLPNRLIDAMVTIKDFMMFQLNEVSVLVSENHLQKGGRNTKVSPLVITSDLDFWCEFEM
ncbi:hypothetical protein BSZ32_08070 [Rubritalea profundi]|uniref:Uncharacterized protein n=1 Tax=Rubritalea profundi TaxID=1658618 RepID=A0A2S7U290_9BACT|nr:hypothetical protein BSZ32_08070 [Rubritalea profundi]